MKRPNPYVVIPIVLLILIVISDKAFNLLSAPSDRDVFWGICLIIGGLFILYRFIIYILNKPI
jgi:hypothetical protein